MLNNLRESLRPALEKMGRGFASTGLSPNFWTTVGLVFALASAVVYGLGMEYGLIIGGILLLVSPLAGISQLDAKPFGVPFTLIYLFTVWAVLIAGACILATRLRDGDEAVSPAIPLGPMTESVDEDGEQRPT